jgi:hypothetical protein
MDSERNRLCPLLSGSPLRVPSFIGAVIVGWEPIQGGNLHRARRRHKSFEPRLEIGRHHVSVKEVAQSRRLLVIAETVLLRSPVRIFSILGAKPWRVEPQRAGVDHLGHGCLLQLIETLKNASQPLSRQMANDDSGEIRLPAGRLFSGEHNELPEIVGRAAGERGIECRDFGFVEVVFHGSLAPTIFPRPLRAHMIDQNFSATARPARAVSASRVPARRAGEATC